MNSEEFKNYSVNIQHQKHKHYQINFINLKTTQLIFNINNRISGFKKSAFKNYSVNIQQIDLETIEG